MPTITTSYLYTGKGPLDEKSLKKTYAELLDVATWTSPDGAFVAYNGMLVAVWLDSAANNGVYYLFDPAVTSSRKTSDVTNPNNWHKISDSVNLSEYAKTADVNAALSQKADAESVYTKSEADLAFLTETQVENKINALIASADPVGGETFTNIQDLVKCVEDNAQSIAALVTAENANTAKLAGITTTVTDYVDKSIAALMTPKSSSEIDVATDGTLSILQVTTDKLVMGENALILDGGVAIN